MKEGVCLFKVEYTIGTTYDPFEDQLVEFLPCPLTKVIVPHIATQDSILFYALSSYAAAGKKLMASPIGVLKLRSVEKIYEIVLLQAEDMALQAMQIDDFDSWITKDYAVALMIQDWFSNIGTQNSREFISWENEFYARRLMKQIGI